MAKQNKITTYFNRKTKVRFPNQTNRTNRKRLMQDQDSKRNDISSPCVYSNSEDDCIIVEKKYEVIDISDDEVNSENIVNGISGENSTNNIRREDTIDSITMNESVISDSVRRISKAEYISTLDDSNGFDTLISSQEVEPIPADNLDESFLTLKEEEDALHKELTEGVRTRLEDLGDTSRVGEAVNKTRRRVVIKRDYRTRFMVRMVKSFLLNKDLHHLFKEEDLNIIKSFSKMSVGRQVLFCRIYWLTPTYKSTTKMVEKYLHVNFKCKAVRDMIESLKAAKLLNDKQIDVETWCALKPRSELIRHFKPLISHVKLSTMSKCKIIGEIKKAYSPRNDISKHFIQLGNKIQKTATKQLVDKLIQNEDFVKIHDVGKSVFDRLHLLMYAGVNPQVFREKRLDLLLLNVYNKSQHFPAMDIKCDPVSSVFPTREYFEAYVDAHCEFEIINNWIKDKNKTDDIGSCAVECSAVIAELNTNENIAKHDPPVWHHRFSPLYLYYKAIELCVPTMRGCEHNCDMAVNVLETILPENKFRVHKKALWYTELVSCHWKLKYHNQAADVLEKALTDPSLSPDDRAPLCDKAQRLAKMNTAKLNLITREKLLELSHEVYSEIPSIKICGKIAQSGDRNKRLTYQTFDATSGSTVYTNVEDFAINHYVTKLGYTKGEHWEGTIVTSIFALAFWDIIYCEMPGKGIFISPYQELPLDMFTPAFYQNRKDIIDQRLDTIRTSKISDLLRSMGKVHNERKSGDFSLYNDKILWVSLCEVVRCLGNAGLHAICKRLAHNYHYAHSGFPDLTVWDFASNKIKFVEVKSHNDKLSVKQTQWMQYLIQCGLDAEVCCVTRNQTDIDVSNKINKQSSSSMKEVLLNKENKKKARRKGKKQLTIVNEDELLNAILNNGDKFEKGEKRKPKRAKSTNKDVATKSNGSIKKRSPIKVSKSRKFETSSDVGVEHSNGEASSSDGVTGVLKTPTKNINTIGNLEKSPLKTSDNLPSISNSNDGVYMRSPTKSCKGVGYFVSPSKSEQSSPVVGQSKSPYKNLSPKARISLSLTRRRLTDLDK